MAEPADKTYDFVLIGSGLGGLLVSYLLAERGFSVCVLEKNVQFGGCLQVFSRDKTVFDTGVHYIGELDEGEPLHRIFSYFGLMDKLELERLDENAFDVISFGDDPVAYPFAQGHKNFVEQLTKFFPEEREAIARYVETIKSVNDSFYGDNLRRLDLESMNTEAVRTDAEAFISSLTNNQKLRNVLAGNIPLYGGVGGKTPLHQHALILNTYLQSAWRCVDGGAQIAKHLASRIREMGGVLHRRKNVVRLQAENGNVQYAETDSGERFYARQFVANFPPEKALDMLEGLSLRRSYQKRIANIPVTTSFFALYVVFKPGAFPYLRQNYYHYNHPNVWRAVDYNPENWPESWLMYPSAVSDDSHSARATTILSYMHYDEVQQWDQSHNTTANPEHRGTDYEEFKRRKAEKLIAAVDKRFPEFSKAIQSYETGTPLTLRDYLNVPRGAAYGKLKDFREPYNAFVSPKSKVPNLFFTGQHVHLHGIKGVTTTALVTASVILNDAGLFGRVSGKS